MNQAYSSVKRFSHLKNISNHLDPSSKMDTDFFNDFGGD